MSRADVEGMVEREVAAEFPGDALVHPSDFTERSGYGRGYRRGLLRGIDLGRVGYVPKVERVSVKDIMGGAAAIAAPTSAAITPLAELRAALREWGEHNRGCSNKEYAALVAVLTKHWEHMPLEPMLALVRELDRAEEEQGETEHDIFMLRRELDRMKAERDGLDKDYGNLARAHDATLADLADLRDAYRRLVKLHDPCALGGPADCGRCSLELKRELDAARKRVSEWKP